MDGAEATKAEASRGSLADVLETIGRTRRVRLRRVVPSGAAGIVCELAAGTTVDAAHPEGYIEEAERIGSMPDPFELHSSVQPRTNARERGAS